MSETNRVHFVSTLAPLLSSGSLSECRSAVNDTDCEGGVATAAAYLRYYTKIDNNDNNNNNDTETTEYEPSLFLAHLDKDSPFVQMTPLGWSVNRLILSDPAYGINAQALLSPPSILTQNKGDLGSVSQRDISVLQSTELPLLLSNVNVPLSNSWQPFWETIHLDATTRLAVLYLNGSNQPFTVSSQSEVASGGLNYIARLNRQAGCEDLPTPTDPDTLETVRLEELFQDYVNNNNSTANSGERVIGWNGICWIPVIFFVDVETLFNELLEVAMAHEYPPALFVDVEENSEPLGVPRELTTANGQSMWLLSYEHKDDEYHHQILDLASPTSTRIQNVTLIHENLNITSLEAAKDEVYLQTFPAIIDLAIEAQVNDPVIAQSQEMPLTRTGSYRRCKGGPCEIGSLFLDAMAWYTTKSRSNEADWAHLAIGNSGGFRGSGWPAGPVRVSNVWDGLPFPNNLCSSRMSGVSLFQMFNFSVAVATFEGENTDLGDRLLQVSSGVRLTYNTQLEGSRLISLEIFDRVAQAFLPVERLKLYNVVTDSFLCTAFSPFNEMMSAESLVYPGEIPAEVDPGSLVQDVVVDYLESEFLDKGVTYQPSAAGRMFNATSATNVLNLVQTEDSCASDEFWNTETFTCISCPESAGVIFLKEALSFNMQLNQEELTSEAIEFVNTLTYPVTIVSRTKPSWVIVEDPARPNEADAVWENVPPGETLSLDVSADVSQLESGTTTQGSVIFGVLEDQQFPGCTRPDASFRVAARVDPEQDLNQLGGVRYVGWILSAIVIFTASYFIYWVRANREARIVKVMQPVFLVMVSLGVMVMGSAIIPLGVDDEIASDSSVSAACMAFPWLLSMGFTIAMSALFSKLWRINKLFHSPNFSRTQVKELDVMGPFAIMFTINFAALLIWTLVDPLEWERSEINGQPWNSYGSCKPQDGAVTLAMGLIVGVVNFSVFFLACYQAFKARTISDEFSESKSVGIALFSWVQLILIGVPVIFLIDDDNPSARFFISVGLTFAVSMSMLLIIYVPILLQKQRLASAYGTQTSVAMTGAPRDAEDSIYTAATGSQRYGGGSNNNIRSHHKHSEFSAYGNSTTGGASTAGGGAYRNKNTSTYSTDTYQTQGTAGMHDVLDLDRMSANLRDIGAMESELENHKLDRVSDVSNEDDEDGDGDEPEQYPAGGPVDDEDTDEQDVEDYAGDDAPDSSAGGDGA
eukprot:CAMPEP_0168828902 /NCGR_PEP_ID=MMETSP0727-20121128/747_1 /TAXON_ID=265536 /ORGANISM="Amphiprora sp., Strain CCMP467" /LENGTH=1207 /DNA_ID=CAMNT_0008882101 /DNA_START=77 /DNA_END=3700 /DNA_ORIENTATION=+